MYAWRDGDLVPAGEATPLRGLGCFETVRIHRAAPFRLWAHRARLEQGLRALHLHEGVHVAGMETAVRAAVEANGLEEGLVRYVVAPLDPGGTDLRAVATVRRLPEVPARVVLTIARAAVRTAGPGRAKTTARDAEERAAEEARAVGAFDAVLLNPAGRAAETTARNLFAARGNVIATPPPTEGALPGVTRAAVLEATRGLGIPAEERPIAVPELLAADEIFLTGSGVGILPVHEILGSPTRRAPGPITDRLATAYRAMLEAECRWDPAAT